MATATKTAWSPAPYIDTQNWVLADGTVVVSPQLEATSSGRRVRAVGTTDSVGNRQIDTLISACIDKIAAKQNTTKLARLYDEKETDKLAASSVGVSTNVFSSPLTLHMLDEKHRSGNGGSTTAVWKFKADGLPLFAYVFVNLVQNYNERWTVSHKVVWRDLHEGVQAEHKMASFVDGRPNVDGLYAYSTPVRVLSDWLEGNPILHGFNMSDKTYQGQMRTAVVRFAEWCKKFDDEVDALSVPLLTGMVDTSNESDIKTAIKDSVTEFKRVASNYSSSFYNELLTFVQTGPVLERLQTNYAQMIADLKTLGLVVNETIGSSEFVQAISGDLTKIRATVIPTEDNEVERGDGVDGNHTVSFHFPTGSVVVNCTHNHRQSEAAEAWENAKFKAELTGELDVLLEYAQAYQRPKEQKRLMKIIEQRDLPTE